MGRQRSNIRIVIFSMIITAVSVALYTAVKPLQFIDQMVYGLKFPTSTKISNNIVVVEINEKTIENIGTWPWDREVFSTVLKKLAKNHNVVGVDIIFNENKSIKGDEELAKAALSNRNVVFAYSYNHRKASLGLYENLREARPNIGFVDAEEKQDSSYVGFLTMRISHNVAMADHRTKRVPSFAVSVYCTYKYGYENIGKCMRIINSQTRTVTHHPTKYYSNPDNLPINYVGDYKVFEKIPFEDIYYGKAHNEIINKIVLIGSTVKSHNDYYFTPLSITTGERNSGIIIISNAVNTLLQNETVSVVSPPAAILALFIFTLVVVFVLDKIRTRKVLILFASVIIIGYVGSQYLILSTITVQMLITPFLIAALLGLIFSNLMKRKSASSGSAKPGSDTSFL